MDEKVMRAMAYTLSSTGPGNDFMNAVLDKIIEQVGAEAIMALIPGDWEYSESAWGDNPTKLSFVQAYIWELIVGDDEPVDEEIEKAIAASTRTLSNELAEIATEMEKMNELD